MILKKYFKKRRDIRNEKLIKEFKKCDIIEDLTRAINLLNDPYKFKIGDSVKFDITEEDFRGLEKDNRSGIIIERDSIVNGLVKKGSEIDLHIKNYHIADGEYTYCYVEEKNIKKKL